MTSLIVAGVSAIIVATSTVADVRPLVLHDANFIVAHGGGCRKDPPPGQCCHSGSKPYHCH